MTNEFEYHIRTDMPVPKPRSGLVRVMRKLSIGHCVTVPHHLGSSITMCSKRAGIKVRRETHKDGICVWRVE